MSRVDYYDLELEIAEILRTNSELNDVHVLVEEALNVFEGLTIMVFLDERTAPEELQTLAAGQRTTFRITFTLICLAPNYESVSAAARARDDLIGRVEIALMENRTLNDKARGLWLEGGLFDNAKDEDRGSFISAGEVRVILEVTSSTV